jgi:hypothetical protein
VYDSEYLFKSSKACWPIFEYPSRLLYNWKETVDRKKYYYIGILSVHTEKRLKKTLDGCKATSHGASEDSKEGNGMHSGG